CAAGVFTAPIALQVLVELFETHDSLNTLQSFVSDNARQIYGIDPPEKTIVFEKSGDIVPEKYGNVVPMYAGKRLAWAVVDIK
ncbi:uncharacterized protein METZ01_LOCUS111843, partial [marine metagenome]